MNNSLERLVEGIIATLRTDVIPNVTDDYARGQAIGVIDLLNNIAPRLEWEHGPLLKALAARRDVIDDVGALLALPAGRQPVAEPSTSRELLAERDRLDAEICELVERAYALPDSEKVIAARQRLRQHMHDDIAREMKLTKKPLFAEIAKGKSAE
ncbi:hypothetical protein [Rhizobium sp.]